MYRSPSDPSGRRPAATGRRGLVGTLVLGALVPLLLGTATHPAVGAAVAVTLLAVPRPARATRSRSWLSAPGTGRPDRARRRPEVVATAADRRR